MTLDELRALCRQWQQRLSLLDWSIDIRFATREQLDILSGKKNTLAYNERSIVYRRGRIWLFADSPDLEAELIHELLHIALIDLDDVENVMLDVIKPGLNSATENLFERASERIIDRLVKALLGNERGFVFMSTMNPALQGDGEEKCG